MHCQNSASEAVDRGFHFRRLTEWYEARPGELVATDDVELIELRIIAIDP
ncbi:MAG: hypothetical protein ACREL7_05210 [Longimicrobiales bacterium]